MITPTSVFGSGPAGADPDADPSHGEPTILKVKGKGASSDGSRRWAHVAAVVLVVVLAGVVRAVALPSALPYTAYVDEGYVLRPAAHMVADRTWDPGWYGYPSLLIELTAAGTAGYDMVGDGVRADARDAAEIDDYNVVAPVSLIVISRLLVWAFAVGTVFVTILLAARLVGRRGAIVAGLLAAVIPALVSRSAISIVDTPAAFFVMASILCAFAIGRGKRPVVAAAGSGALAGLAATSKYPSAAVIVVALTVIALVPSLTIRRRVTLAAASVGAAIVAGLVTMPALVLRPRAVAEAIREQTQVYARKASETGYLRDLVGSAEVGWWLLVPAVIGVALLCWRERSRTVTVGWLVFVAVSAVVVSRSLFQPFRNIVPIVPFLAVAAAATVVEAGRFVARLAVGRADPRRRPLALGLMAGATAVLVVALFVGGVQPYLDSRAAITDSRTSAVDWLVAEVQPDQRVFVASELAIAESDLERIPGEVVEAETADGDQDPDPEDFDFIVTGVFKGDDAPPVPPAELEVAATFGRVRAQNAPNPWRGVNQVIEIRRGDTGS